MAPVSGGEARLLPLEGSRNFRDLGGYRTLDGRRVKWRMLYRSGTLASLTRESAAHVAGLGVRAICDLRTTQEREIEAVTWHEAHGIDYWTRDCTTSFGQLRAIMASPLASEEEAVEAMLAGYRSLPFEQAPAYREIFRRLKSGEVPLLFNCSAGKDRAGTGAALVLTALGVPRETMFEDYLLSDQLVDFRKAILGKADGKSLLGRLPPGVVTAILSCNRAYLEAGFAAILQRCGTMEDYFREVLWTDAKGIEAIRGVLLEV